ncbi:hypothetical protein C3Y87_06925 [Carbonactinospora thermoautotrophica]|uniref:hypothetical protein n=1 Tax=Carbonactinospora thermoautotrophica TaxID=1469144 RepID=UPI00226D9850|nr:hypothetical protein [Carbonactinospora thermoautotrophica]MCX9191145.1 hypothetical protein [Carbonactinospora thermoautotrophica]
MGIESLVDDFVVWAHANAPDVDPADVDLLLRVRADHLGAPDPARWHAGQLRELLLDVYPRQISVDPSAAGEILAAADAFLRYLAAGRIGRESAPVEKLREELAEVGPQLADALADRGRYGLAKTLVATAVDEGVDATDPEALDRWLRDFNNRPLAERVAITEPAMARMRAEDGLIPLNPDDLVDRVSLFLPPIHPTPFAELARAARRAPALATAVRLARWVGDGRPVTRTGVLRPADAAAALRELGLAHRRQFGSARAVPELQRPWALALTTGLLELDGCRARQGPALARWLSGDDHAALETWARAFDAAVDMGSERGKGRPALVDGSLPGLLIILYAAQEPVPVVELWEAVAERQPPGSRDRDILIADGLDAVLERLAGLGAVRLTEDSADLTDLGVWALRQRVLDADPLVGEHADAADMIEANFAYDEVDAEGQWRAWLAVRTPEQAVRELMEAGRSGGPGIRQMAFEVLTLLGADAEPLLEPYKQDGVLGPYIAMWLGLRDSARMPEESVLHWVVVDTCAALLEAGGPEEMVEGFSEGMLGESSQVEFVGRLWQVEHSSTVPVLDAIGRHHPDPTVAKAARKAAFRARSPG